jgi:plasmid stabilization system protein ParE
MPLPVELSILANADIDALFAFVKRRSGTVAAERWRSALHKRLQNLGTVYHVWPLSENPALADAKVRECLVRRYRYVYRVLYRVEGEAVQILRVRSAFQDELGLEDI